MPALTASTERGAGGISQWSPAQHPRTEGRGTSLPGGRSAELPRAEQGGVRPIPHVLCGVFVGLCVLGGRTGLHRLQPAAKLTCASATSWHFEKESVLEYPGHLKQHCHTGSSRGTRGPPRVLLSPTQLQGCGRRSPLSPSSGTGQCPRCGCSHRHPCCSIRPSPGKPSARLFLRLAGTRNTCKGQAAPNDATSPRGCRVSPPVPRQSRAHTTASAARGRRAAGTDTCPVLPGATSHLCHELSWALL